LPLLRGVRQHFPWLHIVTVTACGEVRLAVAAMKAGAADFQEKPVDQQELLSAVMEARKDTTETVSFPRETLSPVETQVLQLLLRGHTSREIGIALRHCPRTIEVHRRCLMRQFAVRASLPGSTRQARTDV